MVRGIPEKTVVSGITWVVMTAVACLGAAAGQDWTSGHGRVIGVAAVLAVIGAALKSFPTFGDTTVTLPVASEMAVKIVPTGGTSV